MRSEQSEALMQVRPYFDAIEDLKSQTEKEFEEWLAKAPLLKFTPKDMDLIQTTLIQVEARLTPDPSLPADLAETRVALFHKMKQLDKTDNSLNSLIDNVEKLFQIRISQLKQLQDRFIQLSSQFEQNLSDLELSALTLRLINIKNEADKVDPSPINAENREVILEGKKRLMLKIEELDTNSKAFLETCQKFKKENNKSDNERIAALEDQVKNLTLTVEKLSKQISLSANKPVSPKTPKMFNRG